ncbi:MAG: chorismate synthase [Planctomycetota bacterium]
MTNTFGDFLRVTTWGESHGPGIGVVVDGVPAGTPVLIDEIAAALRRRRPGAPLTSPRKERDQPRILSGVMDDRALGTPIAIWIENQDARPSDYDALRDLYRPGHADHTTDARYGLRDHRGGGRASARETAARVAAGVIALALLRVDLDVEIVAWVDQVGELCADVNPTTVTQQVVDSSVIRCPDQAITTSMESWIAELRDSGDSAGGWVGIVARGVPAGLGDPVFGKLKALLAHAYLSLPATVALEFGDGLGATLRTGSANNDALVAAPDATPQLATNRAGGMHGGISNGAPLVARVGFKPPSTIRKTQRTVTSSGDEVEFEGTGRHDPCVLPRAVPIVEAMTALVLADRWLARRAAPPAASTPPSV